VLPPPPCEAWLAGTVRNLEKEKGKEKHIIKLAKGFFFLGFEFLICLFEHLLFSCTFVFPKQETQALPRVSGFAEGFLSGPPRSAQKNSRH
jgi:hypothetical protein